MVTYSEAIQGIFAADPAFQHSFQVTFPDRGFGGFVAKPWSERRDIFQVQQDLNLRAQRIPGVRAPLFLPSALPSAGLMPLEVVWMDELQTNIELDRDKVASLGLDMRQVGSDLSAMLGGDYVNRFNMDGRSYKVIPQIERADRLVPQQLLDIRGSLLAHRG